MKQNILFLRDVIIDELDFQAGILYDFVITPEQWLEFNGQRLQHLAVFATNYVDHSGRAQWVDQAQAA